VGGERWDSVRYGRGGERVGEAEDAPAKVRTARWRAAAGALDAILHDQV
jgi:hypothetical protein